MGTHPIFESDFDCLTECPKKSSTSTSPTMTKLQPPFWRSFPNHETAPSLLDSTLLDGRARARREFYGTTLSAAKAETSSSLVSAPRTPRTTAISRCSTSVVKMHVSQLEPPSAR